MILYLFQFRGGCEYFAVRQLESSAHLWRGELYVQKKLDAEKQNVVNVLLRATVSNKVPVFTKCSILCAS